ncbi:MAG: AraC family transcriptional regulator [bacterium]
MKPIVAKLSTSPQSSFKYKWIKLDSFAFNWHRHPEYEIMLMLKSKGKRFVGDNISFYQEGDLVFIGSNLPHTIYSPAEIMGRKTKHEAILIQFTENAAGLNTKDAPEFQAIYHLFKKSARGLQITGKPREVVAKKMIKMNSLEGIDRLIQLLIILDILGKADEHHKKTLSSIEFVNNLQPNQQSRIDRVCTYLNQNYKQNIRLEDAAAIAAMSTTAFCRFFRKSTGKTFIDFVNELRIGHACRLLIESDLTIAEICYDVGFNNLSNFNRRFSERHHICPKDYRREFTNTA